jgi:hypothetical protein
MPVFILFPSMGVWAMRTRLRYFIQPLYQTSSTAAVDEAEQIPAQNAALRLGRSAAYREAQALRQKLQNTIDSLRKSATL